MSYKIHNLISTRKDPNRRGRTPIPARKPIMIGTRILRPGETIVISDAHYARSKRRIDEYAELKIITLRYVGTPAVELVDEVPLDTTAEVAVGVPVVETEQEEAPTQADESAPAETVADTPAEESKPEDALDALLAKPAKRGRRS